MKKYIFMFLFTVSTVMAAGELQEVPEEPLQQMYGGRIQRFMGLLEMSNQLHGLPVKVLVYGQSIMAQGAASNSINELRKKYPYADFKIENRAIGGCTAPALVHAAVTDLYPFYPDLLIFHVYRGEERAEFERIISNVRRYTTADIMLLTHHVAASANGREKSDEASDWRRGIAQKYNCELVDVRPVWKTYLNKYELEAKALLRDGIHLNSHGVALQSAIISRHFKVNPLFPNYWSNMVKSYEVARPAYEKVSYMKFSKENWNPWADKGKDPSKIKGNSLKLEFSGNRIDVRTVSVKDKVGTATILIDSKKPSEFPETYACTRVNSGPLIWFPGYYNIRPGKKPVAEDWVMKIDKLAEKKWDAPFTVTGTVTGFDGSGVLRNDFTSDSDRITFLEQHSTILRGPPTTKILPASYELRWKVYQMGVDTWRPVVQKDDKSISQFTLVQGLSNGKHTLEIIPNGDGVLPVKEILVFTPPLK
jgi:hypothetical protein